MMKPNSSEENKENLTPEKCYVLLNANELALVRNMPAKAILFYLLKERVFDREVADQMRAQSSGREELNKQIVDHLKTRGVREYMVLCKTLRKLGEILLFDLLQERRQSAMLHIIEPSSKTLGHHWRRLAEFLGMTSSVREIQEKYPGKLREQTFYLLLLWEENAGTGANARSLSEYLEKCQMKAAAEFVDELAGGGKKKKKKKGKGKKGKKKRSKTA